MFTVYFDLTLKIPTFILVTLKYTILLGTPYFNYYDLMALKISDVDILKKLAMGKISH